MGKTERHQQIGSNSAAHCPIPSLIFEGKMWINRAHRKEFRATGLHDVRLRADGNIYSGEKLEHARQWVYEKDNKYARRADIKGTIALFLSLGAFVISALTWFGAHQAPTASANPNGPTTEALSKPDTVSPIQPSK
jgi:hypothetical protein